MMTQLMRLSILLFTGTLINLSCQIVPSMINQIQVQPGEVQFQDDFNNPKSGWLRTHDTKNGDLDYVDGAYEIIINRRNAILWSGPGLEFTDVQIEADVINISGPMNNDFGLVCRARDENNFYFLAISNDGYYGIGKVQDGFQQLIGMTNMPPSEDIFQGHRSNHLRADCIGEYLTLFVNGVHQITVQNSEFRSGDVGVFAGNFEEPGTQVRFDNFSVLQP